jgi:ADP-ribose pyrophosphatase YjhB (NUDIX family)
MELTKKLLYQKLHKKIRVIIMGETKMINKQGLSEEQFLETYDANKYERPSVTVDMLIFTVTEEEKKNYRKLPEKVLKLLLIKRGDHPYLASYMSLVDSGALDIRASDDADDAKWFTVTSKRLPEQPIFYPVLNVEYAR